MRSIGNFTRDDTFDLVKLLHQIDFVLQTPCRVNQQNIVVFLFGFDDRIINHGCRIALFGFFDNVDSDSSAPFCQLLNCSCSKCIASSQKNLFAFFFIAMSQFPDRRCLADAVDTDEQEDRRTLFGKMQGVVLTFAAFFIQVHQSFNDCIRNVRLLFCISEFDLIS